MKECPEFRASHEEADDRLMYTIQQLYIKLSDTGTIIVLSADTDIFVVLLYHLKNTWENLNLYFMRKGTSKKPGMKQNEMYPLYRLIQTLNPDLF